VLQLGSPSASIADSGVALADEQRLIVEYERVKCLSSAEGEAGKAACAKEEALLRACPGAI
jgi:hypothetical protein